MNKKILIPAILFIAVVLIAAVMLIKDNGGQPPKQEPSIVLYYGDGCPHCAIVDEFIKENKVEEKVSYENKEVFNNKKNSDELMSRAKACGLPTDSIGVPFLWDGSQCLIGDVDIINFFKQKIGQN
jgi:glutaredoxin